MLQVTNVRLPNATSIGKYAFLHCYALRHITLHPNVNIDGTAFFLCLSLEVLATCAGFELDTGDKLHDGTLNPTVAITRYLKSQCELDTQQRDVFLTYNFMLKLCNHHIDNNTDFVRATPHDRLAHFLLNNEDYRWPWTSFAASSSTAGYVLLYSIYYFFMKTKMSGFLQTLFYFSCAPAPPRAHDPTSHQERTQLTGRGHCILPSCARQIWASSAWRSP